MGTKKWDGQGKRIRSRRCLGTVLVAVLLFVSGRNSCNVAESMIELKSISQARQSGKECG